MNPPFLILVGTGLAADCPITHGWNNLETNEQKRLSTAFKPAPEARGARTGGRRSSSRFVEADNRVFEPRQGYWSPLRHDEMIEIPGPVQVCATPPDGPTSGAGGLVRWSPSSPAETKRSSSKLLRRLGLLPEGDGLRSVESVTGERSLAHASLCAHQASCRLTWSRILWQEGRQTRFYYVQQIAVGRCSCGSSEKPPR